MINFDVKSFNFVRSMSKITKLGSIINCKVWVHFTLYGTLDQFLQLKEGDIDVLITQYVHKDLCNMLFDTQNGPVKANGLIKKFKIFSVFDHGFQLICHPDDYITRWLNFLRLVLNSRDPLLCIWDGTVPQWHFS